MCMHNSFCFRDALVNVIVHSPLTGRHVITKVAWFEVHECNLLRRHAFISNTRCCDDKASRNSAAHIARSSLVDTHRIHLQACVNHLLALLQMGNLAITFAFGVKALFLLIQLAPLRLIWQPHQIVLLAQIRLRNIGKRVNADQRFIPITVWLPTDVASDHGLSQGLPWQDSIRRLQFFFQDLLPAIERVWSISPRSWSTPSLQCSRRACTRHLGSRGQGTT
mmetsp:Transcript_157942/g.303089  ORF Transcript_157942/g.303089 Transcript_157942/m.303089 type:complete len:222 (-) Transcript_157942:16-681(-)